MRLLKQSTTVTIQMGPALDKTDGVTEKTALSPTVEVSKAGAAFAARSSATATSHDQNAWYRVELNTTDTNTLGPLVAKFDDAATHLPVWHEFMVVPADVYDALVAGSGTGVRADVRGWLGTAPNALASGRVDSSVGAMANDVVSAAALATDAGNEIADALLNRDLGAGTDNVARSVRNALRFLRNKWSINSSTLTVTKEDDNTQAWTASVSTASGNPVTGIDPN